MTLSIAVQGLGVAYDGTKVLQTVNMAVERGEWLGIVGPNGAGKTTLLRSLAGLTDHTGEVVVEGLVMGKCSRREVARRVALVPQSPRVPPGMTVADYVLLGRSPHIGYLEVEGPDDIAAVATISSRLDLDPFLDRRLDSLSGGEFQRTVLARSFAQSAPVLLLDEPTAALDIGRRQDVLELVDELRSDGSVTVVSAMHDLTLAGQFTDRLMLLDRGVVVEEGPAVTVLRPELIGRIYDADVRVITDEDGGIVVIPRRSSPRELFDDAASH